jgi:catechol 2,3-dioxygenase-like lactoylglutathione lyase family enzyme
MTDAESETIVLPSASTDSLSKADATANLAVKDVAAARKFYEDKLGFEAVDQEGGEFVVYRSGSTAFNVYRSDFAGTNKATAITWTVGDRIEALVEALAGKGIRFEHYDMPGMRREGDLHVGAGMKLAWFKDPDGNILGLANR